MRNWKKDIIDMAIGGALGMGLVLFLVAKCNRARPVVTVPLRPEDSAKVTVQDHNVIVQSSTGLQSTYVPEGGTATVTVKKTGKVEVAVKRMGWGGGLGGGISYGQDARLNFDKQLGYLNRTTLHAGIGFGNRPVVQPFVSIGYRLDRFRYSQNTSLTLEKIINSKFLSTADGWAVGLRWSF